MENEIINIASTLLNVLSQQGETAKLNAIKQTLSDFENSTNQEIQRDKANNDYSDLDDLLFNLTIYEKLGQVLSEINSYSKTSLIDCERQAQKVFTYYLEKYKRELEYRNNEERRDYIETILNPLMMVKLFFKEQSELQAEDNEEEAREYQIHSEAERITSQNKFEYSVAEMSIIAQSQYYNVEKLFAHLTSMKNRDSNDILGFINKTIEIGSAFQRNISKIPELISWNNKEKQEKKVEKILAEVQDSREMLLKMIDDHYNR